LLEQESINQFSTLYKWKGKNETKKQLIDELPNQ